MGEVGVRVIQIPDRFDGKKWHTKPLRVRWLGRVGKWAVVRNADCPQAMPFCMSIKDWDKLPIEEPQHDPMASTP